MISHDDRRIIAWVRIKLAQAGRETTGMAPHERAEHMRAFWLSLPAHESKTWLRCVLWPGHHRWNAGMTPAERIEQRAKIAEAALAEGVRPERAKKIWDGRSKTKRRAVGQAIAAGLARFWATATPEQRQEKTRAANAARAARKEARYGQAQ